MQTINQWMMRFVLLVGLALSGEGFADTEKKSEALQVNALTSSTIQAVSLDKLEDQRGTGGVIDVITLADVQINGKLSGNVAVNTVNGSNIIDNGSFKDASGLFSIIQNTGNNVLIQDSTTVNVTILP